MSDISDYLDEYLRLAASRRRQRLLQLVEKMERLTKSPIELRFGVALLATEMTQYTFTEVWAGEETPNMVHGFYVFPQRKIGSYRADLALILHENNGTHRLVVECDGHDFHERTKDQAAHDKARDRFLLEEGWPVMRFTGSEIHRDAIGCADQAIWFLTDKMLAAHGIKRERA